MKITILTLFPEMFDAFKNNSIIKRAIENDKVEFECVNIRDYAKDKNRRVDDTPYGGGAGMILQCQPVIDCILDNTNENSYVILMSPRGETYHQSIAKKFAKYEHLVLICGHYEGFDERILDYVDAEISIGDFVLTGGEIAAMAISDSIIRLLDGVIKTESYEDESFENDLLEYPQYTRPQIYNDKEVPDVLLSGHHENIRKWRLEKSLEITYLRRPDLLKKHKFTDEEEKMLINIKKKLK